MVEGEREREKKKYYYRIFIRTTVLESTRHQNLAFNTNGVRLMEKILIFDVLSISLKFGSFNSP